MSVKVLRSARLISVLTLASRVMGLLRDMACGYAFGVSGVMSSFALAFQVPNLFRRLFGEGALSAASIPVVTETLTRQGPRAVEGLLGRLLGLLMVVLVGVCLAAEVVVAGLYWYYRHDGDTPFTLALTALTLPYLVLVCMVALLGGVQNAFGQFGTPALMPIVLNVFMIAGALGARRWLGDNERAGVVLLASSVVVAGMVQLAWQWWALRRCGVRPHLELDAHDPAIRRIGVTMLAMMIGMGAVQVNALMDTLIAYWFVAEEITTGAGAQRVGPAVLYYAQRLYQFPLGVFAIALATAMFPTLSRHAAEENLTSMGHTLSRGLRAVTFEALPCLVGLIVVREPLVAALFGRGQFAEWPEAVGRVGLALAMYALGIWAFAINQLVVRAFYALGDAKTPLRVSVANVFLNLALNLILVQTRLRESGLALATSICAVIQAAVLMFHLCRRLKGHFTWTGLIPSSTKTLSATLAMGLAVLAVDHYAAASLHSLPRLAALVGTGAISFLLAAWLLGSRELREIARR